MKQGDIVTIRGMAGDYDGVYWYTSLGELGAVAVLVLGEDGWHPELHTPKSVVRRFPIENNIDDMPGWATGREK